MPAIPRPSPILDDRGTVTVLLAGGIAVLAGAAAFSIDLGRAFTVSTELQSAVDAAAVAGAMELDGTWNGLDRASAVARTVVANRQTYAGDGLGATVDVTVRFLGSLPSDDQTIDYRAHATTDPVDAAFLEVTATPRTVNNALVGLVGGPFAVQVNASAVAAGRVMSCRPTQFFICNPAEPNLPTEETGFSPVPGQQIIAKEGRNTFSPGNFGLIAPPTGMTLRQYLATSAVTGCLSPYLTTMPGNHTGPTRQGLNTRFGIYDPPYGEADEASYPPAPNVTKGYVAEAKGQDCERDFDAGKDAPTDAYALPRDPALDGECSGSACVGNGDWWNAASGINGWTRAGAYFRINHGIDPDAYFGGRRLTRYQIYLWELGLSTGIPGLPGCPGGRSTCVPTAGSGHGTTRERGVSCDAPAAGSADRRVVQVAVVNCRLHAVNGRSNVPPTAYLEAFMTNPVTAPSGGNASVYLEVIRKLENTDAPNLRRIVQLYR